MTPVAKAAIERALQTIRERLANGDALEDGEALKDGVLQRHRQFWQDSERSPFPLRADTPVTPAIDIFNLARCCCRGGYTLASLSITFDGGA